jgi:hypothetical protein
MQRTRINTAATPLLHGIHAFHEHIKEAMAALASENTIVAPALHNGRVIDQQANEHLKQLHGSH